MSRRLLLPAGVALATAIVLSPLAATAASAQEVSDVYSGGVSPNTVERRDAPLPSDVGSVSAERSELPFTGGDVALVGVVAAGALAGGAVLVVAGRRRSGAGAAA